MLIDPYRFGSGSVPQPIKFVIGGTAEFGVADAILTSEDGDVWTQRDTPVISLSSLAYAPSLGVFLAGGNNRMLRSEDGETWVAVTSMTTPVLTQNFTGMAWSPTLELFMAGTQAGKIYTSPTGLTGTWTERTLQGTPGQVTDVQWTNLFGGRFYIADHNATDHHVQYSEDGENFTLCSGANPTGGTYKLRAGAVGDDELIVLTSNGDTTMFHTLDGDVWSAGSSLGSGGACLVYGNSRFFRGSVFGNRAYSDDGTTDWTAGSGDVIAWHAAAYSEALGKFVAVAGGDTAISADGAAWVDGSSLPINANAIIATG